VDDPEPPFELVSRRLEQGVTMILLIHPGCAFEEPEVGVVIAVGSEEAVAAQVGAHNCQAWTSGSPSSAKDQNTTLVSSSDGTHN